jgi:hypothetical protein
MRKRLYFLMPDVKTARQVFGELLLSHIEERHIHMIAHDDALLTDLPQAGLLEKSNAMHGLWHGAFAGGATGAIAGTVVLLFPPSGLATGLGVVFIISLIGAIMGVWVAGMIASDVPNTSLRPFEHAIAQGQILMIVDVPRGSVEDVARAVKKHHPEADMRGLDPTIPAFP